MKRVLAILMILVLCFAMAACGGSQSPTDVAAAYLDALKAQDTDKLAQVYAGDVDDLFGSDDDSDAMGAYIADEIFERMLEFDYELSGEYIEDDTATVDMNIKTYNFGEVMTTALGDIFTQAVSMAFSGQDDEEAVNEMILSVLDEHFSGLEEADKDYTGSATLELEQINGEWKVCEIDEDSEFFKEFTAGLMDSMAAFE